MRDLLEEFRDLVENRLNYFAEIGVNPFNSFGEDSIRLDFISALSRQYSIQPHEIILEQPFPRHCIGGDQDNLQNTGNNNRERPELDLRVDSTENLDFGILAEFAFFRSSSIENTQPKPARHGKLLNDMLRLALLKSHTSIQDPFYNNFNDYRCLMICVTDAEMIEYGTPGRRGSTAMGIQQDFILNDEFLERLAPTCKTKIEARFKSRARELNIIPNLQRIYEWHPHNERYGNWAIWVWEVSI